MQGTICDLKPGKTALDGLNSMADTATAVMNIGQPREPVVVGYLPDQHDYAVRWTLDRFGEPRYWPSYRDAIAPISARKKLAAERQLLATQMMEKYYALGTHALPRTDADAENARRNLKNQADALNALIGKISFPDFCKSAARIAAELESITLYLVGLDMGMGNIPCIKQCLAECSRVINFLERMPKGLPVSEVVKAIFGALTTVHNALASILIGYSTVTNNESIPNFFLMRLLVGFRLKLTRSDDQLYVSIASAQLTTLLHNQQDWLFDLMQRMIADLAIGLQAVGGDVCFFLKGGRGISYLLGDPTKGENDWDTQILINPELPWDQWWACYREVRDVVNNRLLRYNYIFSASLMQNAPTLIEAANKIAAIAESNPGRYDQLLDNIFTLVWQNGLDEQAIAADEELALESAWQEATRKPTGNCKAELIDVALPRFCTVELLEQWQHVRNSVSSSNGVPCPGPAYFIEELIMMVRESDAGASPSPVKREKRLNRLLSLLSPSVAGFREFLAGQRALAEAARLSLTPSKIASIDSEPNRDLATIMLGQFCTAYQLAVDPNLAGAFDNLAADLLGKIMGPDQKNAQRTDLIFQWCQGVSTIMTDHLAVRGQALLDQTFQIAVLTQTVTAGNTIAPVVQGSLAANCFYRQITTRTIINNKVAPAEFADIHLYFQNCASIADITPTMVQELYDVIAPVAANSPNFGTIEVSPTSIKIFAKQSIALAKWSYNPLVIEFKLEAAAQLITETGPRLTLLGMRPLISWCRERAAAVSEWAMRQQLNETFGALIEMQAVPWQAPSLPLRSKL